MSDMHRNGKLLLAVILLFANFFIWQGVVAEDRQGLRIYFLDVGQGDAIFIEAPSGNQVLIDGGPDRTVLRQLGKVMPFYDRSIDLVFATHADADHIGGLPEVIERYRIGAYIDNGMEGSTALYRALMEKVGEKYLPHIEAKRGMVFRLGDGAFLEILFPDRDLEGAQSNTGSIIARLVYGDTSFMLTGDAPQGIEEYLVTLDGGRLKSDVLKIGHHGSRTSTSETFLSAVSPTRAFISAAEKNRYGHPHKEVMAALEDFGVEVFTTFDGLKAVRSDGEDISVE